MRDAVEGDLLGELLFSGWCIDAAGLPVQLVHRRLAGAGDGLIRRHHDALDAGDVVQGLERHHHLDRGAVGIGDDVPLRVYCMARH